MQRRLPVYLLLDCSESMAGFPLEAVEAGTRSMLSALQRNPYALETVKLSIITFAAKARQLMPLSEVSSVTLPKLTIRPGTCLGQALDVLCDCMKHEVIATTADQKGDYRPLVFILTDGRPTDEWEQAADRLKKFRPSPASIYTIGCGIDVDFSILGKIGDHCIHMRSLAPESFADFFVWMSASVQSMSVAREDKVSLEKIPLKEGMSFVDHTNLPPSITNPQRLFFHVCCRSTEKHYMIRYVFEPSVECYCAEDALPLPEDFFSDGSLKSPGVSSDLLYGSQDCPYCNNPFWVQCGKCNSLFCMEENFNEPDILCPVCKSLLSAGSGGTFNIESSLG